MKSPHSLLLFVLALLILNASAHSQALTFYVASNGNDQWSGLLPEPNAEENDGPFQSLERARDALRALKKDSDAPRGERVVFIRGEAYELYKTFELTREDSGTEESPIIYRNSPGEKVYIIGGTSVDGFSPVQNEAVKARLPEKAREQVLQANLSEYSNRFGQITPRGFGRPMHKAGLEVFYQGEPMTLARWPNEDWVKIADVPAGKDGGKFTYEEDRAQRWLEADDVWLHGFWTQDWADSYVKVREIKTDTKEFITEEPHGVYGYTKGQRYYALNLMEELDQPGEWYLDRQNAILYFWPPDNERQPQVYISLLDEPLVSLKDTEFVSFRSDKNLFFEYGRGNAIEIQGGKRNEIDGCVIRNMGNLGVVIAGGAENGIRNCTVYETGDGAIRIEGGDRKNLTLGKHFAENNLLHNYSRWVLTYRPGIGLSGVGNRVAYNRIHDAPHNAVLFGGNEHVLEYNEVFNVCYETGDVGAFYIGRDWTMRGNIVRYNYFHDITGPHSYGAMAVYLDDAASGTTIYGNIFERASAAAFIGGGRDNTVKNNLFIDCNPSVHVDSRGTSFHAKYIGPGMAWNMYEKLKAVKHDQPPYSEKYPELAKMLENDPHAPMGNVISTNISLGGRWLRLQDRLGEKDILTFENNHVQEDIPGQNLQEILQWLKRDDSPSAKINFEEIPFDRIGPKD